MTPTIAQIQQKERVELSTRKTKINTLLKKYSKFRGWKKSFLLRNPIFNNSVGITMITNAHTGKVSNIHFLEALESFDEFVQNERPEWYRVTK